MHFLVLRLLADPFLPMTMFSHFPPKQRFALLLVVLLSLFDCFTAFQITGALGGVDQSTGQRPLRYEIHGFADSGPAFDLFILALTAFQHIDQSNPFSYFQISGIEDIPFFIPVLTAGRNPWLSSDTLGRCSRRR